MPEKKKSSKAKNGVDEQPTVNIGLVGHVDHGKTTLTEQLSGKWTDTHSEELKRGITIRLGYADSTFYRDVEKDVLTVQPQSEGGKDNEFVRRVSFVDAPGHESLMATMLAGATIMDGAMLLVAANEICPQPQTAEHLSALEISGIKNIIVIQNKIDLVTPERAKRNYKQIKEFLKGSSFEDAPIIPISAAHGVNIDVLLEAINHYIPDPDKESGKDAQMLIARSFDINKPGTKIKSIKGGVLGGAITSGSFSPGSEVEIRPGRIVEKMNQLKAVPLTTTVDGIMTGGTPVEKAHPGGSVALMTKLDPSIIKSDALGGSIVGAPGKLPPIWYSMKLKVHLLKRVVGSVEERRVDPIAHNEMLMLNVNSAATIGMVTDIAKGVADCKLKLPVCAEEGARVTISRRIGTRFRLIGYGIITSGGKCDK